MKATSKKPVDDDLRPEYDFRSLRVLARGPGRGKPGERTVQLAPDVADLFPDSSSVNEALRFLARVANRQSTRVQGAELLPVRPRKTVKAEAG